LISNHEAKNFSMDLQMDGASEKGTNTTEAEKILVHLLVWFHITPMLAWRAIALVLGAGCWVLGATGAAGFGPSSPSHAEV
jgi:hypothetical protein